MNIKTIAWKNNVPTRGIDPVLAYEELEKIRQASDGELTDDNVLSRAKSIDSVLHNWFDWDDSFAANEHRRSQARQMIRSFTVVYEESPQVKTRAFEVLFKASDADCGRTVYSTTEEVLDDPQAKERLIMEAIKAASNFRNKFKHLSELDQVIKSLTCFLDEWVAVTDT